MSNALASMLLKCLKPSHSQVFFGACQCSLGCSWTDAAPNFSSSFNSLGNYYNDDDNDDDDNDEMTAFFVHSSIHTYILPLTPLYIQPT